MTRKSIHGKGEGEAPSVHTSHSSALLQGALHAAASSGGKAGVGGRSLKKPQTNEISKRTGRALSKVREVPGSALAPIPRAENLV